nr:hypothetical protein [Chloroflexaceae bacterium]
RVERYFGQVPLDAFLAEARAILNPQQRRCLLVNLYDAALATGEPPESHPRLGALLAGLGTTAEELQPYRATLAVKNDLSIFHQ